MQVSSSSKFSPLCMRNRVPVPGNYVAITVLTISCLTTFCPYHQLFNYFLNQKFLIAIFYHHWEWDKILSIFWENLAPGPFHKPQMGDLFRH